MDTGEIEAMYRLLALAKYDERYVIPTGYHTTATGDEPDGCSLDHDHGPGMYDADAFHTPLPGTARPEPEHAGTSLRGRVNLLDWDGRGRPAGLFPESDGHQA